MGKQTYHIDFWPGLEIRIDSEAGKGILGSPCGVSVGFLLATHKWPLGNLVVRKLRVFELDGYFFMGIGGRQPVCLCWEVGPGYRVVDGGGGPGKAEGGCVGERGRRLKGLEGL